MILHENLNSKPAYEVTKDNATVFRTQAEIGDRIIQFSAYKNMLGCWDVEFAEAKDRHSAFTSKLTGSGNEFKVFAMVVASMREFIERYTPEQIKFSASKTEPNRAKLYRKLVAKFRDYEIVDDHDDDDDVFITMKRK